MAEKLSVENAVLDEGTKANNFAKSTVLHKQIVSQCDAEYKLCLDFARPRIKEYLDRLKLYNNQKRDKEKFGDETMFAIHQTILSELYSDALEVSLGGREEGDEDAAGNLQALWESDATEMEKDIFDYDYIWDATFFPYALAGFFEFDRDSKTPIPEVLDFASFLRDPRAESVNGNRARKNGMRFAYYETKMTEAELRANPDYFNLDKLKRGDTRVNGVVEEARDARQDAQGYDSLRLRENALTENFEYSIRRGLTHIQGKKYLVEFANEGQLLVRIRQLRTNYWPIVERKIFPIAHSFDGVAPTDFTEDKQRFRAKMLNLLGEDAMADLYGMYLYDKNLVPAGTNFDFKQNKWIGINGNPNAVVTSLRTKQVGSQAQYLLELLGRSAQRATMSPDLQQGMDPNPGGTLGRDQIIVANSNKRYGLAAKVFSWSEKRLVRMWYDSYRLNFKDGIDTKTMRIVGPFGPQFREVSPKDITVSNPLGPDIVIESRVLSQQRNRQQYGDLERHAPLALNDPGAQPRYLKRKMARLIIKKDEVDRLYPLTIDEMQAEYENKELDAGNRPPVQSSDDHICHLEVHSKAKDGPEKDDHILAHKQAMMMQKTHPQYFPSAQTNATPTEALPSVVNQTTQTTPSPAPTPGAANAGSAVQL